MVLIAVDLQLLLGVLKDTFRAFQSRVGFVAPRPPFGQFHALGSLNVDPQVRLVSGLKYQLCPAFLFELHGPPAMPRVRLLGRVGVTDNVRLRQRSSSAYNTGSVSLLRLGTGSCPYVSVKATMLEGPVPARTGPTLWLQIEADLFHFPIRVKLSWSSGVA